MVNRATAHTSLQAPEGTRFRKPLTAPDAMAAAPIRVAVASKFATLCPTLQAAAVQRGVDLTFCEPPEDSTPAWASEVTLAVADPPRLAAAAAKLPKLQWAQSTFAGVDAFFSSPISATTPRFALTRLAGCFGPQMAEYVLGYALAHLRNHGKARAAQSATAWQSDAVAAPATMASLTLGVLGAGDIARKVLAAGKSAFGMRTLAWVRSTGRDLPEVDEQEEDLTAVLAGSDIVVNLLPSTAATRGLLDAQGVWEAATAGRATGRAPPLFINAGRGDVVAEATILSALDAGHLAAAVLDVFPVEPLPATSPLWKHPSVTITPHTAAISQPADVAALFLDNFAAFQAGGQDALKYAVDWEKGY